MPPYDQKPDQEKKQIPATEDLMREHGVLLRILLIYKNIINRLTIENPLNLALINSVLFNTANIAHNFIENYHQRLEEDYLFPVFLREKKYQNLVTILQVWNNHWESSI